MSKSERDEAEYVNNVVDQTVQITVQVLKHQIVLATARDRPMLWGREKVVCLIESASRIQLWSQYAKCCAQHQVW